MTKLKSLPFEEAVKLFKSWGYRVEPGPRAGEVTLILEEADHRTYVVYEAAQLPATAATILSIRWQNGAMCRAAQMAPALELPA